MGVRTEILGARRHKRRALYRRAVGVAVAVAIGVIGAFLLDPIVKESAVRPMDASVDATQGVLASPDTSPSP